MSSLSKKNLNSELIKKAIRQMQKCRIMVVGDVMLDRFIWGKVNRISPEAPIPVVLVTHESAYPGGAANVARNLAHFGIVSSVCGAVGDDANGQQLIHELKRDRILTQGMVKCQDYTTITKTRVVARQQQVVRVDREQPRSLNAQEYKKITAYLKKAIPYSDAVIVEDYGKGFVDQRLVKFLVQECRRHKKLITVDPNSNNLIDWTGVSVVKPNRSECYAMGMAYSFTPNVLNNIPKLGAKLLERWKLKCMLITLGEEGMLLLEQGQKPYPIPSRVREVFDVSGAGDTVIAFFTCALAIGLQPWEAAELANHAAGVVVGKLGTATLTPEELIASVESHECQ